MQLFLLQTYMRVYQKTRMHHLDVIGRIRLDSDTSEERDIIFFKCIVLLIHVSEKL